MEAFDSFPISLNIALFVGAAALVWLSGARMAGYADAIAERAGLGEAVVGLLLLAGVTSLPEIATSLTAAAVGDPPLAVNNLLGSVAMQVAVLAVADAVYGRHALTSVVPDPVVMLQGALNISLLSAVAIAALVDDVGLFGAGAWTWGLLAASMYAFYKLVEAGGREPWIANVGEDFQKGVPDRNMSKSTNLMLGLKTALAALVILSAGSIVALSGGAIAEQSGLGSSFVGYALVAISTSLPEASTVFAALKRGLYTMAISDILGTNILNVALIAFVDLVAAGGPVLDGRQPFAAIAAMLGVLVTGLFVMGLAERRDRAFLRMGVDSILVLMVYAGGLILLYSLRWT